MKILYKTVVLTSAAFLVACGSNTSQIYNWGDGNYASSLYQSLTQEGDPQVQLDTLQKIAKETDKGKKVAPGLYAQIGLLYSQLGDTAKASDAFNQEMQLFPESKPYIQFLLNKGMTGGKK